MYRKLKSYLSKLNFYIGNNPKIEKREDWRRFVPEPYKSVLLISADFELAWAWRYSKSVDNPSKQSINKARSARKNLPQILSYCEKYNIPITWATVGHLFLESCRKSNGKPHAHIPRMEHFENEFWEFFGDDWFEYDPCTNYLDDEEWYAPDLLKKIINSPIGHEIGSHTFSHIDCRDNTCPPEVFRAEIGECKKLAEEWGIKLESFVHPAHTIGHLGDLGNQGFTNYRTNNRNVLGFPIKHRNGLWEFEQTTELAYRKDWSLKYHICRYKKIIERALNSNTLCYFWFHPSVDPLFVEEVFPEIFRFLDDHREDIWITTSGKYIRFLNETK